jgi:hypothetical protein
MQRTASQCPSDERSKRKLRLGWDLVSEASEHVNERGVVDRKI